MRWLLTIALAAVAVLSGLRIAQADKHRSIAAGKDDGRRPESDKDKEGDRSGDKCRDKDSESDKKMKEEWERQEDRDTSRRYGKSLQASTQTRFSPAPKTRRLTDLSPQGTDFTSAGLYPMGGILLVLRSFWQSYLSLQHSALAATH